MQQGDVPGLHAVEKHKAQKCAWDYVPVRFWKLRAATALKMSAILRHDSPSSHARSWAHLCSWSPWEQDPGTSLQPFLSAQEVRAGVPNQGVCLKPCSPRGTLFQSLEQQVFSPIRADPHRTCSRGRMWAPLPPPPGRDLGAQATPGACFLKHTSLWGRKIVLINAILQPTGNKEDAFKLKRFISCT